MRLPTFYEQNLIPNWGIKKILSYLPELNVEVKPSRLLSLTFLTEGCATLAPGYLHRQAMCTAFQAGCLPPQRLFTPLSFGEGLGVRLRYDSYFIFISIYS